MCIYPRGQDTAGDKTVALEMLAFANSVDPGQLASSANWPGSALFVIQYVILYQQLGSSYLIGWQLEVGVAS